MLRPRHLLISIALILIPFVADRALACQCFEQRPPCAEYGQADAVFIGTVTEISPTFEDFEASVRAKNRRVRFSLEEVYRGVEGSGVTLENWINSCEYQFETGKKYLVYAYRNAEGNTLGTHGCSRTTSVRNAGEDLAYMQALTGGNAGQEISGEVHELMGAGIRGVKIFAEGKGKQYQAISDSEGKFKMVLPVAGRYKVSVFLPRNTGVMGPGLQIEKISNVVTNEHHTIVEYDLELQSGGCEFLVLPAVIEKDGS